MPNQFAQMGWPHTGGEMSPGKRQREKGWFRNMWAVDFKWEKNIKGAYSELHGGYFFPPITSTFFEV